MKYSQLFAKTIKQVPAGVEFPGHRFLIQGGFIHQEMAGIYTYLPLGWRVISKITQIVREEMDQVGGQELLMPALHPGENWKKTSRFDTFDVLFKLKGASGNDLVLGPTHEEIIYPLVAHYLKSYKDLPVALYQIQTKFRNELRAKGGLLRAREFIMKDLYSFHENDEDRNHYYEKVRQSYIKIYQRISLPALVTKAGGGTFSDLSEEFQTPTPSGEDLIYICDNCHQATNKEIMDVEKCAQCGGNLHEEKAIEVGNIFPLKQSFAKTFKVTFIDKEGKERYVSAGCYGFGISRVMGTLAEVFHDDRGPIWPESVAPYQVHLVGLDLDVEEINQKAEQLYKQLQENGVEVLYDDRKGISVGEKFADADLIGIPYRVVISKKTEEKLEVKKRSEEKAEFVTIEELFNKLQK